MSPRRDSTSGLAVHSGRCWWPAHQQRPVASDSLPASPSHGPRRRRAVAAWRACKAARWILSAIAAAGPSLPAGKRSSRGIFRRRRSAGSGAGPSGPLLPGECFAGAARRLTLGLTFRIGRVEGLGSVKLALSSVESVELETDKRRLNWFGVRTGRVERLGSVKLARRAPARSTALPSGAGGSISRNLTGRRGGFHPRWPPSGAGPRRRCSESPEETLADGPGCSATGQT